uniref:NAD(P)H-quinone oxidoreductase subunit H, organellar chromatophore n=1 Tax=Paulinella chromatophora TaxID=39717 RepID=NDHH_PAUCH|nr:NADH dehydrogenase (ubiquinone) [Paulinella chromatophora]B1X4A5.1 RecName: Full=NAD(P)H-quinone oxidoreductase subunit H, organellar chromatophore; AltName: Full=NAD(P)H dehydrogenase subunit H; AltName: Full=NADH-plastoquinone oxidoreductase 49 kDa subunit; AltName: Full=NADH-plastoquinone oxidoreductase subunit H [Paulinella chromatophora]ACB42774.1 NADH dehydrogenase (ubiquinone) [Paulinella chromatophora]
MTQLETRTEPMIINFGPHHPSMHGVLRLVVTLDGEDVVDCEPVIGYLHRGMEKIAESRTAITFVPYVSRWDYAAGMFNEAITVNATEKLMDLEIPRRASYIRVLMLELNRIANHLLWLGPFLADVGAQTPFFYIFREREMIYDLWEAVTGQRLINNNYFRVGGVACDLPFGWLDKCEDFCDWFGPKIDEYEQLITNNPIFRRRIEGLGVISREQAINWSLSGPMLRASGVPWDLRKVDHYECYDDFDWDIAWAKEGDCYARYLVRIEEMRQSLRILKQALKMIPGGPTENLEAQCGFDSTDTNQDLDKKRSVATGEVSGNEYTIGPKKINLNKCPEGELYCRVESGKGELGVFIISNGEANPWRWKIRAADFNNLQILPHILTGAKVADVMAILGSIDVIMGSVDR